MSTKLSPLHFSLHFPPFSSHTIHTEWQHYVTHDTADSDLVILGMAFLCFDSEAAFITKYN